MSIKIVMIKYYGYSWNLTKNQLVVIWLENVNA
jgi:hypothetical protein